MHPFASAIDSGLPAAPEHCHMMLAFKADGVPLAKGPQDRLFNDYPDESLAQWHQRLGLEQ